MSALKRGLVILVAVVIGCSGIVWAGSIKDHPWPKRPAVGPCIFPATKHLFDGETLDGWEVRSGFAKFHVEDGAIVGTTVPGSPNTFLCTKEEYADFDLRFEVKVDPGLNSGVQIRSHAYGEDTTVMPWGGGEERRHKAGRVFGYQVEIASGTHSGSIYDEARSATWLYDASGDPNASSAFKDGQWNRFWIRCSGAMIQTWVNDVQCAEIYDPRDQGGFIGLQVHSYSGQSPAQVRWRRIRVGPLGRHDWTPMFDGRSLEGWTPTPGGRWEVRDGILIGTHSASDSRRGLLVSEWQASNFSVRFSFKAVEGNSGFCFRFKRGPRDDGVRGLQAEIDAAEDVGGLYDGGGRGWVVRPSPADVKRWFRSGQWNTMTVMAHFGQVAVFVNGRRTADLNETPERRPGQPLRPLRRWPKGFALELPGGQDVEVHFKDIEILEYQWPEDK